MSISVPKEASDVLASGSPIAGEVAEMRVARTFLEHVESKTNEYKNSVVGATVWLASAEGKSVTKVSEKIQNYLVPGAMTLSSSTSTAKEAFDSYIVEVERIHLAAGNVISEVDTFLGFIRQHVAMISTIASEIGVSANYHWQGGAPPTMPTPLVESKPVSQVMANPYSISQFSLESAWPVSEHPRALDWANAVFSWNSSFKEIQTRQTQWRNLLEERRQAESRLINALSATVLGRLLEHVDGRDSGSLLAGWISGEVRGIPFTTPFGSVPERLKKLVDFRGDPSQVAAEWRMLGLTPEAVANLPLAALAELASLDGIPAWAQDIASRRLVEYALESPRDAYKALGYAQGGVSYEDFYNGVVAIDTAVEEAELTAQSLPGSPIVQLVGFGQHDGALTAAISLGDIDNASNLAVNISGMNSNVDTIGNGVDGAESLYREAAKANPDASYAVVTWIGYKSPDQAGVGSMDRADAGAQRFADFLDGIHDSRRWSGKGIDQFTVLAHSYGSTMAAEALKLTNYDIDNFVTYGSAGIKHGTTIEDLNVRGHVFSTYSIDDNVAPLGYVASQADASARNWGTFFIPAVGSLVNAMIAQNEMREDPRAMEGVVEFSAMGGTPGDRGVTVHDMYTEGAPASVWNWFGKIGYLSAESGTVKDMGSIIATGGLR